MVLALSMSLLVLSRPQARDMLRSHPCRPRSCFRRRQPADNNVMIRLALDVVFSVFGLLLVLKTLRKRQDRQLLTPLSDGKKAPSPPQNLAIATFSPSKAWEDTASPCGNHRRRVLNNTPEGGEGKPFSRGSRRPGHYVFQCRVRSR